MAELQTYLIQGTHFEISRAPDQPDTKFIRIGDRVKVMKKGYDKWNNYAGVVVSFDNFKDLPTINIVYVDISYSTCNLQMVAYNEETKDLKVAFLPEDSKELDIDKASTLDRFNNEIEKKKAELAELFYKKAYFEKNFGKFFSGI